MRLSNIKIKNYRLLIDADLKVDDSITLIVGRNNTAKTSCIELIDKVLKNRALSYDDYPLLKRKYAFVLLAQFMRKKMSFENLCKKFPVTAIDFYVDYSLDDSNINLGALSPFIIDVDVDNNMAIIHVEYSIKISEDSLRTMFESSFFENNNFVCKPEDARDVCIANFAKIFEMNIYAINPKNENDRQLKAQKELVDLFPFYSIPAERMLGENGDHGEYVKYGEWLRVPKSKELFAREKLFVRRTGDYPLCCYDNDNYIPERASHALYKADDCEIPIKYVLGLLNSKLIRWVFRYNNSLLVGKPLAQVNAKYIERLPLKYADIGIEDIVDELIDLYKQKIGTTENFLYFIEKTYGLEKTSEKMQDFNQLSFAEFLSELSKRKVIIQAKEKMELLPLFEDNCKRINEVLQIIEAKESLVDKKLCEIYNLSEKQIDYMNNY